MCDYSLMEFPNRLAVEGEVLVVHRFRSGSLGLAAPHDCCGVQTKTAQQKNFWAKLKELLVPPEEAPTPAVCIPPGARLVLLDVPVSLQKWMRVGPVEEVRFVQTSATENRHRDAVCFRNGETLRLQELTVGQRVEVVDLGNTYEEEPHSFGDRDDVPAGVRRG